jgi:D-lyxose ketol-isomerase
MMKRLPDVLVIASLLILFVTACGRDPGARMGRKYAELVEVIQKHRTTPARAVTEAKAWLKKSEKDLAAICEDRDRLKQTDQDAALKVAVDHMNQHREATKKLDSLIERWEPAQRVELSALLLDLAQVCLPDAEKVPPLR